MRFRRCIVEHQGEYAFRWKTIVYMFRMTFSVLAVAFRFGVLKEDRSGENDTIGRKEAGSTD